jgi:hypothetical protein
VGEPEVRVRMVQLELEPGGHRIELFQFDAPPAGGHRLRPADVGFVQTCVTTTDPEPLLARLEVAGGRRVSDPVAIDGGVNARGRAVYVRDRDGQAVELFRPGAA